MSIYVNYRFLVLRNFIFQILHVSRNLWQLLGTYFLTFLCPADEVVAH